MDTLLNGKRFEFPPYVRRTARQLVGGPCTPGLTGTGRGGYHSGSGFSGEAEKEAIYNRHHVVYDALQNEHHSHSREAQQYEVKTVEHTVPLSR